MSTEEITLWFHNDKIVASPEVIEALFERLKPLIQQALYDGALQATPPRLPDSWAGPGYTSPTTLCYPYTGETFGHQT